MVHEHLIRVGLLGQVGRFHSPTGASYPRGRRVICRTARGLEVGTVLSSSVRSDEAIHLGDPRSFSDGTVLRLVSPEDELLLARLESHRHEAYAACVQLLEERDEAAVLVDVEHLFDGKSLYFYFLGAVSPQVDLLTAELATLYETKVEFRRFAETLEHGCGPACGTADGGGCSTSCSSCGIAAACGRPPLSESS